MLVWGTTFLVLALGLNVVNCVRAFRLKSATLSKGINRGIGTIIGGGLGCCAAILANQKGEMFEAIVVGSSLFISGCLEEFCRTSNDTDVENRQSTIVQACKSVLHSKANEESLTLSVMSQAVKEPSEIMMLSLGWILRELGESIKNMKQCRASALITPKLQSMKLQLNLMYSSNSMIEALENDENLKITCNSLLMEIVEKMGSLVKEVEELGELANFQIKKLDV
ncbi:aluminum-activated malate transporter 13-like [Forsythia ovata]|uniref:Aluminum-activated malate transporter 13-like n=1 Tax=Forsythia ovata TaxID=205694 RepID=A0ABD1T4T3_9LAMI